MLPYGRGSLILLVAQDYFFAFFNLPTAYFFLLQVIGYDANYTVRIDEDSIGRYICRASVKGFPEISATAELFMKGPPRILNTGKYIRRQQMMDNSKKVYTLYLFYVFFANNLAKCIVEMNF